MTESVTGRPASPAFDRLTRRERDTLRRTAAGETAKEIGRALGISHRTVHNYQQEAARKLGVTGSVRAAALFIAHEAHRVDVHSAPENLAHPPENAASDDVSRPEADGDGEAHVTRSEPTPEAPATGRMLQTNTLAVLREVLAWGLGLSFIGMAMIEIYKISF